MTSASDYWGKLERTRPSYGYAEVGGVVKEQDGADI